VTSDEMDVVALIRERLADRAELATVAEVRALRIEVEEELANRTPARRALADWQEVNELLRGPILRRFLSNRQNSLLLNTIGARRYWGIPW
jgi:hypothetical protein